MIKQVFSLDDFVTLSREEEDLLAFGHASIADALGVNKRTIEDAGVPVPASIYEGDSWRDEFRQMVNSARNARFDLIALEMSTFSPVVADAALQESRAIRRIDALFDQMGNDFCCVDTQSMISSLAQEVAGRADASVANWLGYARIGVNALSFVHPVAGMAANFGLNKLEPADAVDTNPDEESTVLLYARLLLACQGPLEVDDAQSCVSKAIRDIRAALDEGGSDRSNRLSGADKRSTSASPASLLALLDRFNQISTAESSEDLIGDLAGMQLSQAMRIAASLGATCEIEDAIPRGGTAQRMIFNQDNWLVVRQEETGLAGSRRLKLYALKRGESPRK